MALGNFFQDLSPHTRVAMAVAPFLIGMVARLFFGANRTTRWMITIGTVWVVVNVFLAPYSPQLRQDILNFRTWLP